MKNQRFLMLHQLLALVFGILCVLFTVLLLARSDFFQWAFARHQNLLSWYIRPLFLVPFCFFSYRRSLDGILGTVFFLLTSMFWFPVPITVDEQVVSFLEAEKDYLTGDWSTQKILISLLVPASLSVLSLALWKRSLWLGIAVLIFIAVAKMLWSVVFGGTAGRAILLPALIGLAVCILLVAIGFIQLEKRNHRK